MQCSQIKTGPSNYSIILQQVHVSSNYIPDLCSILFTWFPACGHNALVLPQFLSLHFLCVMQFITFSVLMLVRFPLTSFFHLFSDSL